MIKEFTVENFLSFDSKQEISFEATPDTTSEDNLVYKVVHPKTNATTRLLRMTAIYGANASGKTNLLSALAEIWKKLFYAMDNKEKEVNRVPFALRKDEATTMSTTFFIDNIEYQYEIRYKDVIEYELLRFNPNGVMSLFYKRNYDEIKNIPIIEFGDNTELTESVKDDIIKRTYNNHTVLSTFGKISIYAPKIEVVYNWLRNTIMDFEILTAIDVSKIKNIAGSIAKDSKKKSFFLRDINSADFNITDIFYEEKEIPDSLRNSIMSSPAIANSKNFMELLKNESTKVGFEHSSAEGKFTLPIESESRGTLKYFDLSDKLYNIITSECVYMIDEIENTIHYDLLIFLLQKFLINNHKSQLIFTTHDQLILDEDFMRRDMVWFAEKDKAASSTELYSAVDFGLHKNVSIYKAYKAGKLGARPEIGSPFIKTETYE